MTTKIYTTINGVKYYGWDAFYYSYWEKEQEKRCIVGPEEQKILYNLDDYLDQNFVPAFDSEIHIAPGCSVGMEDIRKNYKVKRALDSGTCNVFSSPEANSYYFNIYSMLIFPNRKQIFLNIDYPERNLTKAELCNVVQKHIPDLTGDELIESIFVKNDANLRLIDLPSDYRELLENDLKLKTPCIHYKRLQFRGGNELDTDLLYLVYKTGREEFTDEAKKNFVLQLQALNQSNWREYPVMIALLLKNCLFDKARSHNRYDLDKVSICLNEKTLPKAIRDMCHSSLELLPNFTSQKDIKLCQDFIKMLVKFDENELTKIEDLTQKFYDANIPFELFYKCYQNRVQFKPRVINEES